MLFFEVSAMAVVAFSHENLEDRIGGMRGASSILLVNSYVN